MASVASVHVVAIISASDGVLTLTSAVFDSVGLLACAGMTYLAGVAEV